MKAIYVFVLAFLFGCGGNNATDNRFLAPFGPQPEPDQISLGSYGGYVDMFLEDAAAHGTSLTVKSLIIYSASLNKPTATRDITLGECFRSDGAVPRIAIDSNYWDKLDPTTHVLLLYHELGHCLLHRAHVTDKNSIMYPDIMGSAQFLSDYRDILDELFDKTKYESWNP